MANNLVSNMKSLVASALAYNIAEAAMDYYNDNSAEVNLADLASDIVTEGVDFEEGYILSKLRGSTPAGEALGLPDGIAEAIKRCYFELDYYAAEKAVHSAVRVLKGHALIDTL